MMSTSNLMRWSGSAALVGGALLAAVSILETILFGSQPGPETVMSSAFIIIELGFIAAAILIILGLMGLYAHQAQQAGRLGLTAFVIAVVGTVLVSGMDWSAAFFGPWLAEIASPEVLNAEPTGIFAFGLLLSLVLLALGYFLFGLVSLQAGSLPRAAAVLLMVGAVLILVMGVLEIGFDVVVLGIALAWMGYALWSEPVTQTVVAEGTA